MENTVNFLKKPPYLVIDGVRNMEEIEYFKKNLELDFFVIAIDASDVLRRKRASSRGRIDDSNNLKDLEERDQREIRWGLQKIIADADIVILNDGSLDQFKKKVLTVFKKLLGTIL